MIVMDVAEEHCIDLLKLPPRANEPFKAAGSAVAQNAGRALLDKQRGTSAIRVEVVPAA